MTTPKDASEEPTMTLPQLKSSLIGRRLAIAAGALSLLACLLLNWKIAGAQEPAAANIEHADKEPQNWLTFFGNYQAWSYTPLDQIKRENVKRLAPAWAFATGSHFGLQSA